MDQKKRRPFTIEKWYGKVVGRGVMYEQGNVQILWLSDRGWTGVQYSNLGNVVGILEGATVIRLEDDKNHGLFSNCWVRGVRFISNLFNFISK